MSGRDKGSGKVLCGDHVEAELVRELAEGLWLVKFPDDFDETGRPILRVRRIV